MKYKKMIRRKTYDLTTVQKDFVLNNLLIRQDKDEIKSNVIGMCYYDDSGNMDAYALEKAYYKVLENNEAFRMSFVRNGLQIKQFFKSANEFPKPVRIKIGENADDLIKYCKNPKVPLISLKNEFLTLGEIYTCDDGSGGIIIWHHHVSADGFSLFNILYPQLCYYYTKFKGNSEDIGKTVKSYPFSEHIQYEKNLIAKNKKTFIKNMRKEFNTHVKYYRVPVRSDLKCYEFGEYDYSVSGEFFDKFESFCKQYRCTDNSVIMTAIAAVVRNITGAKRFMFSNQTHGRMTRKQRFTAGPLLVSVPAFFDFVEDVDVKNFIINQNKKFIETSMNMHFSGLEMVIRFSLPCYIFSRSTFHDDEWMSVNNLRLYRREDGNSLKIIEIDDKSAPNAYDVAIIDTDDGFTIRVLYLKSLCTENKIKEFAAMFDKALGFILDNPDKKISDCIKNL